MTVSFTDKIILLVYQLSLLSDNSICLLNSVRLYNINDKVFTFILLIVGNFLNDQKLASQYINT